MTEEKKEMIFEGIPAFGTQHTYYCPYDKEELVYLWHDNQLVGIGLDNWVYCPKCKSRFKIGLYGIKEFEDFDDVKIIIKSSIIGSKEKKGK